MTPHKDEKIIELIKKLVAEYISRESNHLSLITVTGGQISDKLQRAVVFITVLPEQYEDEVLLFLKRQSKDIREYIMSHSKLGRIPFLTFVIDKGEKNRQRIDDLSRA
jgi:ribosome-binding factor A